MLRKSDFAVQFSQCVRLTVWMFDRAATSDADVVVLDLEDSVSSDAKLDARVKAIEGLLQCDW